MQLPFVPHDAAPLSVQAVLQQIFPPPVRPTHAPRRHWPFDVHALPSGKSTHFPPGQ